MPSEFDPEKVERIAIWMSGEDDVQVWDESTHKRGHKTREEGYVSSVYVKAHLYDSLLSIYHSQQERIGQLEDVVRAFACVTVPLHTEFARSITCDSDYGIHVRKLMDTPVVHSLLSKPEGESVDSDKAR